MISKDGGTDEDSDESIKVETPGEFTKKIITTIINI